MEDLEIPIFILIVIPTIIVSIIYYKKRKEFLSKYFNIPEGFYDVKSEFYDKAILKAKTETNFVVEAENSAIDEDEPPPFKGYSSINTVDEDEPPPYRGNIK